MWLAGIALENWDPTTVVATGKLMSRFMFHHNKRPPRDGLVVVIEKVLYPDHPFVVKAGI